MVMSYWSANTLFCQVSIDHKMNVQYQRCTLQTKVTCPNITCTWSMATMLCDVVVAFANIVCMHPWATPLAVFNMRKVIHRFLWLWGSVLMVLWAIPALLSVSYDPVLIVTLGRLDSPCHYICHSRVSWVPGM